VSACHQAGISVTTVPGPTALVSALVMSGFNPDSFVFLGFLSKRQKKDLSFLAMEHKTVIFYEAPHKLTKTLHQLRHQLNPHRRIAIVREITKLYEEQQRMTLAEACDHYAQHNPMGEYVLVLEGVTLVETVPDIPIPEQVSELVAGGMLKKEAIKQVAKIMNLPKSQVYGQVTND